MFLPSRMSKIRIVALRDDYDGVMTALHDSGLMQIDPISEAARGSLKGEGGIEYKWLYEYAQRFRALDDSLIPVESNDKILFNSMGELVDRANGIRIDERVAAIVSEKGALSSALGGIRTRLSILEKLEGFREDVSILNGKSVVSFIVSGPATEEMVAWASKNDNCAVIRLEKSVLAGVLRSEEKDFAKQAQALGAQIEAVPEMSGKQKKLVKELSDDAKSMDEKVAALDEELLSISKSSYPIVNAIREQLDIEMEKLEATTKLGVTRSVVVIEGWTEHSDVNRVRRVLAQAAGKRFEMETLKVKDVPPTKLKNPARLKLFESFIKFYSLPKSNEVDPTIMFAFIFPIFFGLMVGDFGYGLFMLVGALLLIRHIRKKKPGAAKSQSKISKFVHTIVGNEGLVLLAKSIIPGAIIAMVLGIAFNEYFGFQLPYTALFNVEAGLPKLLDLAGWIGVAMVSFGFILGFANYLFIRQRKKAFGRLGWLAAAIGFVIFGLNILHRAPLGFSNPVAIVSYVLLVAGIITIVATEGFESMMELPSLISHILSYTRIVGILLASVILAEVIDFIFIGGWHHSILLGLVGTLILIVGQLFNITIAMFEPGIQGARLIYVEFFSKFFSGNGVPFVPFVSRRRRTLSRFSLEPEK